MADYRLQWTTLARTDFLEIVQRIADEAPLNAPRVVRRILRTAAGLRTFPRRCREVPEHQDRDSLEIREAIVAPWRIMYLLESDTIRIIAVVDGRRNLYQWLPERLSRLNGEGQ